VATTESATEDADAIGGAVKANAEWFSKTASNHKISNYWDHM
jgi:hypothetical protein